LTCWRQTYSGKDFVVYGPEKLYAFEVKNTAVLRPKDFHGLAAFKIDYPQAQTALLYRGNAQSAPQGILCVPCDTFPKKVNPLKPLLDGI
jgi:hypothetical protein